MSIELLNGNSYELIKTLPDKSIDLVVTDPPYLIESTETGSKSRLAKSIQKMNNQLAEGGLTTGVNNTILEELVRVMKKINIYIWCNHKQLPQYLDYFVTRLGCRFDILIWNKTNATPLFNNKYLTDKEYCLYFRRGGHCNPVSYESAKTVYYQPINLKDKQTWGHPTIKPLNIIENLILNSSLEGQTILDPFMGSGTTGIACKMHNRNFIGMEIDKTFYKTAEERITSTDIKTTPSQPSLFD